MTHLSKYKEVLLQYSPEHNSTNVSTGPSYDKAYLSEDAKEWKHWFDGFISPISEVQAWLTVGVYVAEYAAYLDEYNITPDKVAEFQVWLGERVGDHFTQYTPASVKRAVRVWESNRMLGDVMQELGSGRYGSW